MSGLTSREAAERRKKYGPNLLSEGKKINPFALFICQFKDFLTLVLLGGTIVSLVTGEYAEAITIAVIVLLNGIMSFVQEFRTEKFALTPHRFCDFFTACFADSRIIYDLVGNGDLSAELLLFQHQHSVFCTCKVERGSETRRTAAYDNHVIELIFIIIVSSIHQS